MYIPITDFMRKTRRKIMKKRFMTGVVAAVTALAMSVSALAAGSIVGTIDMPNASTDKGTISLEPVMMMTFRRS